MLKLVSVWRWLLLEKSKEAGGVLPCLSAQNWNDDLANDIARRAAIRSTEPQRYEDDDDQFVFALQQHWLWLGFSGWRQWRCGGYAWNSLSLSLLLKHDLQLCFSRRLYRIILVRLKTFLFINLSCHRPLVPTDWLHGLLDCLSDFLRSTVFFSH